MAERRVHVKHNMYSILNKRTKEKQLNHKKV